MFREKLLSALTQKRLCGSNVVLLHYILNKEMINRSRVSLNVSLKGTVQQKG